MKRVMSVASLLFRSLKVRILVGGIAAMLVSVGIISLAFMHNAETNILSAESRREVNEAANTALRLSRQVVSVQRALDSSAAGLQRTEMSDFEGLRRFTQGQPILQLMFSNIFVASPDGSVRIYVNATGARKPDVNLSRRRYFQETLARGRRVISPVLPGKISNSPVVVFTQPVRDAQGVFAVFGGSMQLESQDLLEGLIDGFGEGDTMTVVTDERGVILAHPDHTRLLQSLSSEPRLAVAFASWQAEGAPAEPSGLALQQPHEVVSAAGVPGPNWMIWRVRSESDLLAPLHQARLRARITAAALIFGFVPLLLGTLWWLLRPLSLLEHRARHMFDAAYPAEMDWPEASGEIASLSKVLRSVGIDRARLEQENAQTLRKLTSVMDAAPMGIAFAQGLKFELLNREFCRLFGGTEIDLLGENLSVRFDRQADFETFLVEREAAFVSGEAYGGEWQMRRVDGTSFWAALRCSPVDANNISAGTAWTFSDVDEIRASREMLEWAATHDPLTGLANRKEFEGHARRLLASFPASAPTALIFIDLDRFKPVNDTAGHLMGDLMLLAVSKAISACVRSKDLVARIGGDEFAILLEGCAHEGALLIAEEVRQAVCGVQLPWEGVLLKVGASLGVAELDATHESLEGWIGAADEACYAAKASGRDAVRFAKSLIT
jgi:diguanylate cyclase (GGDEF)-like protein/PAS domain S-box-containing protein